MKLSVGKTDYTSLSHFKKFDLTSFKLLFLKAFSLIPINSTLTVNEASKVNFTRIKSFTQSFGRSVRDFLGYTLENAQKEGEIVARQLIGLPVKAWFGNTTNFKIDETFSWNLPNARNVKVWQ